MNTILGLGIILTGGLLAEKLVSRYNIPAISSYIVLGIILGPYVLDLTGEGLLSASETLFNIALGFIAFHLGRNFFIDDFKKIGNAVLSISLVETAAAWLFVTAGIYYLTDQPFHIAIIYGSISAATAPATTMMVVRQYKAKGAFTNVLLGVVAIDDAWGIIAFSLSLSVAKTFMGGHLSEMSFLFVIMKAFGGILIALALGSFAAYSVSKGSIYVRERRNMLTLILGAIFITTGAAMVLHISPLLSNMFFGAVLINIDKTAFRFFDSLQEVDWPLYTIFYVLAGANLEIDLLASMGYIALLYIILRCAGKIGGAYAGGLVVGTGKNVRNYMGFALIPQAGVALGLALLAKANFPQMGDAIFATIMATTVLYELFGPMATRYALLKAGDLNGTG